MNLRKNTSKGFLLVLVLVFGAVFFIMVVAFTGFVITQSRIQEANYNKTRALEIAEAGLDYYKWYLAHFADDTTNGTGLPGPYVHTYTDPEGSDIGEFSLEIASSTYCNNVYAIDIYSTGYTYDAPNLKRTVYGRYARPTVSEYSYIVNGNVWAGTDRTIIGPYHSNGYIRMDGTNNSTVSSGFESWVCNNTFLTCDPPYNEGDTLDGVFGSGPNSDLWVFPSAPIDFGGMTIDLLAMKNAAQNDGGIYIGPSGDYGYRLDFQSDGTVDVYIVDRTWSHEEYSSEVGYWYTARNLIRDDDPYATYTISGECPLIFVEDKVWLEGDINQKVSLAVADGDQNTFTHSIILHDNILYTNDDAGLLAISELDVLVGYDVPDDMELNGIFVAETGKFGRNRYRVDDHGGDQCRNSLTINGTIVSYGRVGTKWTGSGCGGYSSGFDTRYNSYDRDLVENPPPLTPKVSDTYSFIEWREVE